MPISFFKKNQEPDPLDFPSISDVPGSSAEQPQDVEEMWERRRWDMACKLHMQYVRSCVLGKFKAKPSFIARLSRIHADELIKEMRKEVQPRNTEDDDNA